MAILILNDFKFTDDEWKRFFSNSIGNPNNGIVEKTRIIQEDYVQVLKKDDGTSKNIYLIDKKNVHKNKLQVINQYVNNDGNHDNRYDVTILVNGLPLVHVELKKRGVDLREAFNQIERYLCVLGTASCRLGHIDFGTFHLALGASGGGVNAVNAVLGIE